MKGVVGWLTMGGSKVSKRSFTKQGMWVGAVLGEELGTKVPQINEPPTRWPNEALGSSSSPLLLLLSPLTLSISPSPLIYC